MIAGCSSCLVYIDVVVVDVDSQQISLFLHLLLSFSLHLVSVCFMLLTLVVATGLELISAFSCFVNRVVEGMGCIGLKFFPATGTNSRGDIIKEKCCGEN